MLACRLVTVNPMDLFMDLFPGVAETMRVSRVECLPRVARTLRAVAPAEVMTPAK